MINNNIQWFPGHMHKARKEIEEALPSIDVIIEVLDARIPFSSENPLIGQIRKDKPVIKILNKKDLADPEITAKWIDYFDEQQGIKAIAITTENSTEVSKIVELCRKIAPHRGGTGKNIRTMIMGIPNVGKSTLINKLVGHTIAKTGNQPAVTRQQQRINLQNGVVLSDTPGILWPKVENPHSGLRLAATGAIKDTAIEYDEVAFYIVMYLANAYPERLKSRYQLDKLPQNNVEIIESIANKRGCLRSGGRVDYHKASEILINDLRSGALGNISLEKPAMISNELIEAQNAAEKKAKEKILKKQERRKKYLKNKR